MSKTRSSHAPAPASVLGEDFDGFRKEFEARLDDEGRAMYNAFGAKYDLAAAIISRRRELGITQTQLADRARVNQSDISRLERGNGNLSQRALERVALALGGAVAFVPQP